jgi:transketolase
MRSSFIRSLTEIARIDSRVVVVTPDMGFSVLEKFRDEFPGRLINAGIAEQNSVGLAAGLALCGKIVYVYSIVPFVTMRPYEQVRIDACYQNLPVKLVGSGGGLTYGSLGPTHHSIEDISLMRGLPNMTVYCPGDPMEAELCTQSSHEIPGPAYIRLAKGSGDPIVHKSKPDFHLGKAIQIRNGPDGAILVTGNLLGNAVAVSELLSKEDVSCSVFSLPTVKPFDSGLVLSLAEKGVPFVTIEEHSIIGGIGSAASEIIAESGLKARFRRIGLPDQFAKEAGSQDYLRKKSGLDSSSLAKTLSSFFKK